MVRNRDGKGGGAEIGEPMKGKGRRIVDGIRESGEL